ncbi:polyketide cyclase/dehydrase/lipid transport protein [Actinomycetospora succinea]|uniref:Polyketide cyclase/dehydrase/lipid transport protein n=1 Tax=Actinomycetospora succinea TaxID=663603 RepID=A0A4R6VH35_9PSEU|nr:SRPBCC family protein [Actinomycetospora succinea]TDQ60770.1 polyketide cyclase/dehydrase/lipid transport protein [Actinomycetospora succinea]
MTEAATDVTSNGHRPDADASDDSSSGSLTDMLPTDRLKQAATSLLKAAGDRAVSAALDQVEGLTSKLTDVAENPSVGLQSALGAGGSMLQGGSGVGGALKGGLSAVKDKAMGALGMGGDDSDDDSDESGGGSGGGGSDTGRGKFKFMNIYEVQDVGVPLRVAYDQWTQMADFPSFMKKVETVNQESDEKVTWTAKVFWSRRSWQTTIREQVPDSHILWVSSGAKGSADGIVTFSELAPNLTRIVLIMEYYPKGFFEKTGNIWRAVGRRARLEFKHFCRHVMMDTLINREELEGWRGEIRDSEVVKTHEEALEEEQRAAEDEGDEYEDEYDDVADEDLEDQDEDEDDDLVAEDEELDDDELEDEYDDELSDEDAEGELDEDVADEDLEEVDDELEDEPADDEPAEEERPRRRSRRQSTPA